MKVERKEKFAKLKKDQRSSAKKLAILSENKYNRAQKSRKKTIFGRRVVQ